VVDETTGARAGTYCYWALASFLTNLFAKLSNFGTQLADLSLKVIEVEREPGPSEKLFDPIVTPYIPRLLHRSVWWDDVRRWLLRHCSLLTAVLC
jgi:hypothetical protein